jgi:hypothetical protein
MTWTRRDTLAVLGLALAPFLFFWPLFAPGPARRWFEGGDFIDQFFAFASYEVASLAAGRLPLWNPFAYAGAPFWADIQAAVAYPPSLALSLASAAIAGRMPLAVLQIEAVLHIGLAAVFTYLFARRLLASRPGALVAALVFACGGYLTGYPPLQLAVLETAVWLPLALLGVLRLVERSAAPSGRRFPLPDPVLPLALALAILAGHPQTANYLIYTSAAWLAWLTWPWSRAARTGRPWLAFALAVLLALGLSAVGWLPALEFQRLSNRAAADYAALSNGFPPRELLGAILPGITKWSPLYVGVLPLLLAGVAVWRGNGRAGSEGTGLPITRFWLLLATLSLLLALGRHGILFDLAYLTAPGFNLFRGQERAALLFSFSLAMLTGTGMRLWLGDRRGVGRAISQGALVLAGLGLVLALVAGPELRLAALRLLFLAGAISVLATLFTSGRIAGRGLVTLALVLIGIDLYAAGGRTNLVAAPPSEIAVSPIIATLRMGGVQRVQNDDRFPPNFGVLHGIESTGGASPLRLATFDALVAALAPEHEDRLWDLLAVSHVITWRQTLDVPAEGLTMQGEGDAVAYLHALDQAKPFVWRVAETVPVADDRSAAEQLRAPDFDPLSTVLIHTEAADVAELPAGGGGGGGIGAVERAPGELAFQASGEAPGWVLVSELAYPGWQAEIDGQPAPLYRADLALLALWLPAGEHAVRITFTAPMLRAGLLVTLISLVILLALVVAPMRARRRDVDGVSA